MKIGFGPPPPPNTITPPPLPKRKILEPRIKVLICQVMATITLKDREVHTKTHMRTLLLVLAMWPMGLLFVTKLMHGSRKFFHRGGGHICDILTL